MGPIKTHGPPLLAAIEANDVNKVTDILTNKFRDKQKTRQFLVSEVRHPQSESVGIPLLAAASLDDPSILRFLVNEHAADVNFVHECGSDKAWKSETALVIAVRRGCCAMANVILSLGGDVNIQDHKGRTPLLLAVLRTDRRMVRLLLARGARVDVADSEGKLPLHLATVYGHRELVGLLVSHGADLYQCGPVGGMTAVHLAAREGHAILVRMFGDLYQADGNVVVRCDGTRALAPIHVAAAEANPDCIRVLIEYCRAKPDLEDSEGNTAMHCALLGRCDAALGTPTEDDLVESLQVLINHGANVNSINAAGETPLHLASRNGLPKVVNLLVDSGCDPTITDKEGNQAVDLLASNDEFSRRLIIDAMKGCKNGPQVTKSLKKSKTHGLRSYRSGSEIHDAGLHDVAANQATVVEKPRPAVRKTKSVERLDQDTDDELNHHKLGVPQPTVRSSPRVRSSSVQGPEVTDLNSSNASQASAKKMGVLKKKKKEKLVESVEQPEAQGSTGKVRPPKLNIQITKPSLSMDECLVNGEAAGDGQQRKTGVRNEGENVQQKTETESRPDLQSWLDEQARLLKETEKAANGGPVAQSTPPISRNLPSSKENLESSADNSDGDAVGSNPSAKTKPPPPPKPTKVKPNVITPRDTDTRKKTPPAAEAGDKDLARHSDNSKDAKNNPRQRRDSQQSLTGVAQLDIAESSPAFESSSVGVKVLPSVPGTSNRLNMSFDSAQKRMVNKENRPVPKSREMRSKKISESESYTRLPGETPTIAQSQQFNFSVDHAFGTASSSAQPLPAQRKPAIGRNQQSSVKANTLIFERAADSVSPTKNVRNTRTPGDVADGKSHSLKPPPPATISGANLSNSFEAIHKMGKEVIGEVTTVLKRQQDRAVVKKSESEEEDDSDESEETEEEEDEEEEEEEEESEEEEADQNITQTSKKALNTSMNQRNLGNHEVRAVTFYNSGNPGFIIVGGNAEGIFIHSIDPSSSAAANGLTNGDQILRANGQRILGRTKEEADQMLRLLGGQLTLHVRNMMDQYKAVVGNGGIGDGFYVQAQFNGDGAKKGELSVHEGDIFSVTDTLPENCPGLWKAHKINAKKNEEHVGTIPNRQKAEQIAVKQRLSLGKSPADQRGGNFFRSFRRSKSAERNSRNQDEDEKSLPQLNSGIVSYQRVVQRLSENRRPVVVLGLFCDSVISMLIRDAPEHFEAPQEAVESPDSTEEPVDVKVIRSSCLRGRHCLIVLTPPAIEFLQQKTDLNPIIVYISPVSKSVVKTVKAKLAPNYSKSASYLYDEAVKFEKTYGHLFSTCVAYTTDDWWFFHLKEAIGSCQNQPIWRTLTDDEVEASNEAELNRICPKVAVVPANQFRPSRDKTPRVSRTTDDLPLHSQNGGRIKLLPPIPPSAGGREHHRGKGEGTDIRNDRVDGSNRSILKQRQTGGSVSSDLAGGIRSGLAKGMSVSFDQEAPEMLHHSAGKTPNTKSKSTNSMGHETQL